MAARDVVFMPRVPIVIMMSSTVSVMDTSDDMNVDRVASVLRFAKILASHTLTFLMSQAPIMYMARAASSLSQAQDGSSGQVPLR